MRLLKRFKLPAVIAAGVVLAGGGTAYAVVGGDDAPTYRTVTATTGDVEQTLTLTGVVDAARRSDLAFGTDGTVAKVKVEQGEVVKTGQVIATLDTEDLDAAVTEAQASLASAKAQLESDQDAQTSSVDQASSPTRPSGSSNGSSNGNGNGNASNAALLKKLKEQQHAVLEAQSAASAAITAANAALAAQTAACADAYQTPATPSGDATTDAADPTDADAANAACDAALADVQEKQAAVKQAQDDLADALTALTRTLGDALGSVANQPTGAISVRTTASSATTADVPNGSNGTNGTDGSSGGTVTAARLASDQAQIDQAEADLVTAKAARSQAVLRSTRSGTLASLDVAKGDAVSAGSAVAVVVGGTAVTLTGTVAETAVDQVKVGQAARVTVAGSSKVTTGTVTAIGLTADTANGSASYPVTVTVEDPTIALPTGSRAQVAIVLSTAKDVVTLPISAITKNGDTAVVRTWDGAELDRTTVTLGAVGARTVAITKGVEAGDEVVIADVDEEIDGASSELNERGGFGPPGGMTFRQGGPGGGGPRVGVAAN